MNPDEVPSEEEIERKIIEIKETKGFGEIGNAPSVELTEEDYKEFCEKYPIVQDDIISPEEFEIQPTQEMVNIIKNKFKGFVALLVLLTISVVGFINYHKGYITDPIDLFKPDGWTWQDIDGDDSVEKLYTHSRPTYDFQFNYEFLVHDEEYLKKEGIDYTIEPIYRPPIQGSFNRKYFDKWMPLFANDQLPRFRKLYCQYAKKAYALDKTNDLKPFQEKMIREYCNEEPVAKR